MEENGISLTFPGMFNETLRKFGKHNAYAYVGEEPRLMKLLARRSGL
jgi:hypothetical protein